MEAQPRAAPGSSAFEAGDGDGSQEDYFVTKSELAAALSGLASGFAGLNSKVAEALEAQQVFGERLDTLESYVEGLMKRSDEQDAELGAMGSKGNYIEEVIESIREELRSAEAERGLTECKLVAVRAELRELQQEGAAGLKAKQERSVSPVHSPTGSPAPPVGASDSPTVFYTASVRSEESGTWASADEGEAPCLDCPAVRLSDFDIKRRDLAKIDREEKGLEDLYDKVDGPRHHPDTAFQLFLTKLTMEAGKQTPSQAWVYYFEYDPEENEDKENMQRAVKECGTPNNRVLIRHAQKVQTTVFAGAVVNRFHPKVMVHMSTDNLFGCSLLFQDIRKEVRPKSDGDRLFLKNQLRETINRGPREKYLKVYFQLVWDWLQRAEQAGAVLDFEELMLNLVTVLSSAKDSEKAQEREWAKAIPEQLRLKAGAIRCEVVQVLKEKSFTQVFQELEKLVNDLVKSGTVYDASFLHGKIHMFGKGKGPDAGDPFEDDAAGMRYLKELQGPFTVEEDGKRQNAIAKAKEILKGAGLKEMSKGLAVMAAAASAEKKRCFKCGQKGHIKPNCTATEAEIKAYRASQKKGKRSDDDSSDDGEKSAVGGAALVGAALGNGPFLLPVTKG